MDISAVRTALAAAADAVDGLTCLGYQPDSVPEPCFYAGEVEINPDFDFGGKDDVTVTCYLLVSRADDKAGQARLDGYLTRTGSGSVRAALEAARGAPGQPALSGLAADLHVTRIDGYRLYRFDDIAYYGARIHVRVIG